MPRWGSRGISRPRNVGQELRTKEIRSEEDWLSYSFGKGHCAQLFSWGVVFVRKSTTLRTRVENPEGVPDVDLAGEFIHDRPGT